MLYLLCRLVAFHHLAFLVDEELGEVPLDVGFLLIVRVGLRKHLLQDGIDGMRLVPAGEAFLLLEELIEGRGIVAVDLYLLELWELRAIGELAKLMDAIIRAWGLLGKLVAREVENLKALGMILLVKFLKLFILWRESAFSGGVDDKQHFISILP